MKKENNSKRDLEVLQRVIDLLPTRVFWKDKNSVFLGCNTMLAKDGGKESPKDIIGKTDFEMSWKDQAKLYQADDKKVIETGKERIHFEEPQTTPDGKKIWLRTSKVRLTNKKGEVVGVLGLYDDITEIKKAQDLLLKQKKELEKANKKLKEMDEMKINFLNIVTHELKTPLTAIMAYLDIMKDTEDQDSNETKKRLETLKRNAKQLNNLIGNILEVARIESKKFELAPVELNVKKKIKEIIDNLKMISKNKGIKLVANTKNIPEIMITDEQRFEEILNNLISNAIKFTEKGSVTIETKYNKKELICTVRDTGVGIPKEHIKKLFNDFYQVDAIISRKYGGTGLGLSITKKIIELQGGKITVKSKVGKGSEFIFTLPLNLKNEKKQ